jgi:hypothetical protein
MEAFVSGSSDRRAVAVKSSPIFNVPLLEQPALQLICDERGAVGLLTKPIDFALLRHEIDTRLGQAA